MNALRRAWYALWRHVAQVQFVVVFGIRVFHRERLPACGGVLVISNHQSYLDPILAAVGMPRPFHPMARESLFRVAPFRWLIRSLYAFPVRRASADLGAIREALRRLKAGSVVLMFPEGTRTRDGSIGRLVLVRRGSKPRPSRSPASGAARRPVNGSFVAVSWHLTRQRHSPDPRQTLHSLAPATTHGTLLRHGLLSALTPGGAAVPPGGPPSGGGPPP